MNTPLHASLSACHWNHDFRRLAFSKAFWIRVNRVLAWSLVVSPLVQILLRSDLVRSLLLDLAILVAHGLLSLQLFGMPKLPQKSRWDWLLWVGIRPIALSARNDFLMSGWTVALALAYLLALLLSMWLFPLAAPVFLVTGFHQWLLLPFAACGHLFRAARYAVRRWGVRNRDNADMLAVVVVLLFVVLSIANLSRPLFR